MLTPLLPDPSVPAVALDRPVCVIGSRSRVHLPLLAKTVSRAHAMIVNDRRDGAGEVYIRDLASCNGLYVNGASVREVVLHDGDQLRIGPFVYRCTSGFGGTGGAEPLANLIEENSPTPGSPHMELHVAGAWLRDGRLSVTDRTALIGLREDCDVILPGPGVDPAHAVVFRRGGKWYIRDLDSQGGTILNGARVRENTLSPGDTIRIAAAEIRYVLAMTTGPSAAEAPHGMVSPWESLELDDVDLATEAQSILPTPVPALASAGSARRADAPLASFLPPTGRPRAASLPSAALRTERLAVSEVSATAHEPPATPPPGPDFSASADDEPFAVPADGELVPLADAPPTSAHSNGDGNGEALDLDMLDTPALSNSTMHPAHVGDDLDPPATNGQEPDFTIPLAAAEAHPPVDPAGNLAHDLAALEQAVSDASLAEPQTPSADWFTTLPIAESPAETPASATSERLDPHDLPQPAASEDSPAPADAPPPASQVSPPAPVRQITRLVGRLYRDVSALDSAWRTIKESRPDWTGDDPDRRPDEPHDREGHHEEQAQDH